MNNPLDVEIPERERDQGKNPLCITVKREEYIVQEKKRRSIEGRQKRTTPSGEGKENTK
jgi:hypothetical protein